MRDLSAMVICCCFAIASWAGPAAAETPEEYPLEPPARHSPRATLTTFLDSVDKAWELYSGDDPGFVQVFRDARECLDLGEIPPLVLHEVSTKRALLLKEVLDRLVLPTDSEIPDAGRAAEDGITRWSIPHTEIMLVRVGEGEREGEWLFSTGTVARAEEFYNRVLHLPYQPGRAGGHVVELSSGSRAILLTKLAGVMPSWFSQEIGGMMAWQWFGLALLVVFLAFAVAAAAWIGRRWHEGDFPGRRLAGFLVPFAMISTPPVGRLMIERLFPLPGEPALVVRLLFSMVGFAGLAWLVGLVLTRVGELTVRLWFRNARPLKKQLVRVVFRIASIVVITGITVKALQILGVPVAGVVAGLGVGGLAIALAAQSTLENFIGGIILFTDQPVRVGDLCKFGNRRGTVEAVGLRSVKIRTLDRSIVTVPNADFAKMQLENLSERDRVLMQETLCLQYGTPRDRLRQVVTEIESMLRAHPRIGDERLRVRFMGFGEHFLEVELFAYALTDNQPEFFEIREDVLLKVMEIVEEAGVRLALPTEIHYVEAIEPVDGHQTTA